MILALEPVEVVDLRLERCERVPELLEVYGGRVDQGGGREQRSARTKGGRRSWGGGDSEGDNRRAGRNGVVLLDTHPAACASTASDSPARSCGSRQSFRGTPARTAPGGPAGGVAWRV